MPEPISTKGIDKWRGPYFLLEPLSWIQDRLGKAIEAEPTLVGPLLKFDRARMHLVALALAYLAGDATSDLVLMLLHGSKKEILRLSLGYHPLGLNRALRHLPPKVLATETYRNLIDLLNNSAAAKFLHHATLITEPIITALHRLPPALRRPGVMTMIGKIGGMVMFVDGLRLLAWRATLPFDLVASQIASLDQPDQIAAKIRQLVESLPLPDLVLPATIGEFRRVDSVAEIRTLAKNWKNCLADYLYNINEGTSAIYLSEELDAVCFLTRHGRMGWFLLQAKGPKNVAIDPDQLAQIHATFAAAGIPDATIIEPIKSILLTDEWSHH